MTEFMDLEIKAKSVKRIGERSKVVGRYHQIKVDVGNNQNKIAVLRNLKKLNVMKLGISITEDLTIKERKNDKRLVPEGRRKK